MNPGPSWVLIRPGAPEATALREAVATPVDAGLITWHRLLIRCVDMKRQASLLYGVPTWCGQSTPTQPLDVLAYSAAVPRWATSVCVQCLDGVGAEHQPGSGRRLIAVA